MKPEIAIFIFGFCMSLLYFYVESGYGWTRSEQNCRENPPVGAEPDNGCWKAEPAPWKPKYVVSDGISHKTVYEIIAMRR